MSFPRGLLKTQRQAAFWEIQGFLCVGNRPGNEYRCGIQPEILAVDNQRLDRLPHQTLSRIKVGKNCEGLWLLKAFRIAKDCDS